MTKKFKIFILEDEIGRWPRCQILHALEGHEVTFATSVPEAKTTYKGHYDLLLLDHDMEGFYEDPSAAHGNTGTAFVNWLVDQHLKLPQQIILHSQNPVGRKAMRERLADVGYTNVDECPFGPAYIKHLKTLGA